MTDYGSSTIRKVTLATGQVTTIAGSAGVTGSVNSTGTNSLFFHPLGMAVDSATNLYVADYGNHLIRKITPSAPSAPPWPGRRGCLARPTARARRRNFTNRKEWRWIKPAMFMWPTPATPPSA